MGSSMLHALEPEVSLRWIIDRRPHVFYNLPLPLRYTKFYCLVTETQVWTIRPRLLRSSTSIYQNLNAWCLNCESDAPQCHDSCLTWLAITQICAKVTAKTLRLPFALHSALNNRNRERDNDETETFASATALSGRKMRGNAYMAPITSLHRTPSIVLSVSVVMWAFNASSPRTWLFSYEIMQQQLHNEKIMLFNIFTPLFPGSDTCTGKVGLFLELWSKCGSTPF